MWVADLADIQLISKYNKIIRFLLCEIDIFSKYAWVVPLKDKKESIVNAFHSILDNSNRKPNKIWVDQGSEFYNNSFKKWLKDNNIKMCIQHTMKESLFLLKDLLEHWKIRITNIWQLSKNVYFDVLDDIVDKYNNTYHRTIEVRPVHVKFDSYAEYSVDSSVGSNDKDPEYKIVDHVRISKYKNIFATG